MAKIDIDPPIDIDQTSNMSGKDTPSTPEPEKDIMANGLDRDVEKQSKEASLPQKDVKLNDQTPDPNIVEFDGPHDPDNPKNWKASRKMGITASMGSMTFVVTFSSSIFAVCLG